MKNLTGTLTLTRVTLRRERTRLLLWITGLALLMFFIAQAAQDILTTQEDLIAFTQLYAINPVFRMLGLASGPTMGGFIMTRGYLIFAILIPLMSTFAVIRNTREDEDKRLTELTRSHPIGKHAHLAAAFTTTALANTLLALLLIPALLAHDLPLTGTLHMAATMGAIGIAFAAIAALAAQLASTARAAKGLSLAAIGASFAIAGIGNVLGTLDETGLSIESHWISWISPLGWGQQVRPYTHDHTWILALFAAFTLTTLTIAILIERNRDVGHALLPQRRGPPTASWTLSSPTGLAWRLQRGPFLGWTAGLVLLAALYGVTASEVEGLFDQLEEARELVEQIGGTEQLLDAYLTMTLTLLGTLVAVYALITVLRMRAEEDEGHLELLLATKTSRGTWMTGHINNALLGTLALLALTGLNLGASAAWVLGDASRWVPLLLQAAIAHAPAALLIASLGIAAYGFFPNRGTPLAWALFLGAFITGPIFGPMLDLPVWVQDLSPFTHSPAAPAEPIRALPLVIMLTASAMLTFIGWLAFRRRDLLSEG